MRGLLFPKDSTRGLRLTTWPPSSWRTWTLDETPWIIMSFQFSLQPTWSWCGEGPAWSSQRQTGWCPGTRFTRSTRPRPRSSPIVCQTSIVSRPNPHLKPKLLPKPILRSATCWSAKQSVHHVSPRQRLFVPIFGRFIFLCQICVCPYFWEDYIFVPNLCFAPGQALMGDKLFKTGEKTFKTKVARLL